MRENSKIHTTCSECGVPIILTRMTERDKHRYDHYKTRGRAYCSDECRDAYKNRISSQTMARTNRKYASERMKQKNPMQNLETRAKVSAAHKAKGWKPPVQGGNGRGPTVPQKIMAKILNWPVEVAIPTKMPRGTGYPTCYKVDIGNPDLKIGVELDGNSHHSRKEEDRKKEELLTGLGWTILRFSNREVTEHLEECVQTVMSTISRLKSTTPTRQTAS